MLGGALAHVTLPQRLATALTASLVAAGLAAVVVWNFAFDRALEQAEDAGAAQLTFAVDGLEADLVR